MTTKVLYLLLALVTRTALVECQKGPPPRTDPEADEIDADFFKKTWLQSSEAIASMADQGDAITGGRGGLLYLGSDYQIISKPFIRCEDGPLVALFSEPNVWYYPLPRFLKCQVLPCSFDSKCIAGNTRMRKFYTICYKLFNCWGLKIWIPIGIKRLCLFDERNCECKPRCNPIRCFQPRRFNPKSCDCECPYTSCNLPYELDPSSCQCRCPKDIVCRLPYRLDHKTCKCVCANKCKPGYKPDPQQNCKCVPICDRRCPYGAYLDPVKCKCVGDCSNFKNEYDCTQVDICEDYCNQKCKWYPSHAQNSCQCDCCKPKDSTLDYDCTRYTGLGEFGCNFYYDSTTNSNPCMWACG